LLLFSDHARLESSISINGGRRPDGVVDFYIAGVDICGTTHVVLDGIQILNPANRGVWVRPEQTGDPNWRSIGTNWNLTAQNIEVVEPGTVAFEGENMIGGTVDVRVRDISENNTMPCSVCLSNITDVKVSQLSVDPRSKTDDHQLKKTVSDNGAWQRQVPSPAVVIDSTTHVDDDEDIPKVTSTISFSDVSLVGERWTFPGSHDATTGKLVFSPPESPTVLRLSADIVICSANYTIMQSLNGGRSWSEHPAASAGRIPDSATDHKGIPPSIPAPKGSKSLFIDVQPFRAFPCAVPNEQTSPKPCAPTTLVESQPTEQFIDWGLSADGSSAEATIVNAQPCNLTAPEGFERDHLLGWWTGPGSIIGMLQDRTLSVEQCGNLCKANTSCTSFHLYEPCQAGPSGEVGTCYLHTGPRQHFLERGRAISYRRSPKRPNKQLQTVSSSELAGGQRIGRWLGLPAPVSVFSTTNGAGLRLSDGSFLFVLYVTFGENENAKGHCCHNSVIAFNSSDGVTWHYISTVGAWNATEVSYSQEGPNEVSIVQLKDNHTIWSVMRVDGGDGSPSHRTLPFVSSSSTNRGCSWSALKALPSDMLSASPQAAVLGNGALLVTGGRPGSDLWVSTDGFGRQWTRRSLPTEHNFLVGREKRPSKWKFCDAFLPVALNHTFSGDPSPKHDSKRDGAPLKGWIATFGYNALTRLDDTVALVCYQRQGCCTVRAPPCSSLSANLDLDITRCCGKRMSVIAIAGWLLWCRTSTPLCWDLA
jgi:hypothetical protein